MHPHTHFYATHFYAAHQVLGSAFAPALIAAGLALVLVAAMLGLTRAHRARG